LKSIDSLYEKLGASQIVVFVKRGKFGEPTHKAMTKEEYLAIASAKYDELQALKKIDCGIIGSGAIESAHRTVVQKRMKQSGQRWSSPGAQNMLNLRVTYMNERWDNVIQLAKTGVKHTSLKKTG
jgi:hypothetical protein